ncbi:MAG TPA: phosphohistidine phosphatase SixA [Verrucomicrobiae bacterium]|nr:phosphohistidine phosphatase SixA [Verrucomicrobiae bacterium]
MKLYLLRHATAVDVASSDAERELTREGRDEAQVVGAALAGLGVRLSRILSSPMLRARQTAEITAKALQFPGDVEFLQELANNTTTPALLKSLKPLASDGELLLVGHMPALSEHLAALIGAESAQAFPLGKASVACIELEQLRVGTGQLRWLMRQKQLREIAAR